MVSILLLARCRQTSADKHEDYQADEQQEFVVNLFHNSMRGSVVTLMCGNSVPQSAQCTVDVASACVVIIRLLWPNHRQIRRR